MADGDFILSEEDRAKLRERMGQVEDTRRDLTDQRNAIVETDSPDDAAYDLKRSKELGIPRAAVGGDRDGHKAQQQFEELNRLAEEAPKSRRWLAEPDNYAIARDEVKDISLMEKLMAAGSSVMYWGASDFGEALPDVAKASPAKFKQQYYGTLQQQQEMAGAYQRELDAWKARRKPIFSDGQVDIGAFNARLFGQQKKPEAPLALKMVGLGADDSYSELGRKAAMGLLDKDAQQSAYQARKALEEFQAKMPRTGDFVTDSALSGVSSLINMLPMIGMAIATKSPNAPSVLMGGQVQGESYARAREEGLSPLEADQYAGSQAAIEVAMERVGLGVIFKNLEDGAPLVRQFLEGQTTEQVQEQITTVLQDFVDWQTFNPEKTIAEFAAERPEAAAQTAIATLVASGAMQGSIIGADALMTSESDRQARVKNTEAQQRVSKIFDAANRLKTLQRSPEAAVSLLDEITGDTDVETVTIDLDGIGPALEEAGIDPLEALTGLGLDDAALKQAYDLGGEIEVRTSALLTSPLMRDNRAQIEPHVRHNADEYTPAKREAAEAELETEIQNIVAEGRKGLEDAGSSMEADDQVRDLVTQRLQQGGAEYAQQDVANAEIELMTAMNNTLARALGRDPVEFFNERFPDVKASLSEEQGAEVLQQAQTNGYEGQDLEGAQEWEAARAKGLDMSPEGRMTRAQEMGFDTDTVLYHGTTASFDEFSADGNHENHHGAGMYFTSSELDVANNYAGMGPDLTNKIEREAERLAGETDREYDDPDVIAEARQKWVRHDGATMPVFVRVRNPVIVNGQLPGLSDRVSRQHAPKSTFWEMTHPYDEELDEYGEPEGPAVDLIEAVRNRLNDISFERADEFASALYGMAIENEGLSADEFEKSTRDSELYLFEYDYSVGQLMRDVYRDLGHDGIVLNNAERQFSSMGMNPDTTHTVVFDPANIRSVNAAFDPDMSDSANLLNQLIGPKAKGADQAILSEAQKMAKATVKTGGVFSKRKPKYTRQQIWDKTAEMGQPWYQDKNGDWISEIEDGAVVVNSEKGKVSEVIEYPALYEQYPEIGKQRADARPGVDVMEDTGDADIPGARGSYEADPVFWRPHVRISTQSDVVAPYTAVHELQHAIDHIEKRKMGKRSDGYALMPTERRAFNTMYRTDWTMEERIAVPPWKTEQEAIDWFLGGRAIGVAPAKYAKDGLYDPFPVFREPKPKEQAWREGEDTGANIPADRQSRSRELEARGERQPSGGYSPYVADTRDIAGRTFLTRKEAERNIAVLAESGKLPPPAGGAMTVEEMLDPQNMVNLDAPYSEQPQKVQTALRALWDMEASRLGADYSVGWDNAWIRERIGDPANLSGADMMREIAGFRVNEDGGGQIDWVFKNLRDRGIMAGTYIPGGKRAESEEGPPQFESIMLFDETLAPHPTDAEGNLMQQARGTFSPTRNLVTLFDQRNASTLMHELSHWYLTELHNMATAENAPAFVKKQYEEVLRWARVPYDFQMFDENGVITDQGREVQESFAETFEAYLRDGKAPTAALRDAFRVFKRWITSIYRRLTGLERANLTPEIRSVMDRMVASEDAIKAASKPVETLADQQAKAMLDAGIITEKQYDNFRKRIESARESAKEDLLQVLMQQHLRESEGWWRDERKRVKGDLTREFDRSQVGRAWNWLAGQGWKGDVPESEYVGEGEFYQDGGGLKPQLSLEELYRSIALTPGTANGKSPLFDSVVAAGRQAASDTAKTTYGSKDGIPSEGDLLDEAGIEHDDGFIEEPVPLTPILALALKDLGVVEITVEEYASIDPDGYAKHFGGLDASWSRLTRADLRMEFNDYAIDQVLSEGETDEFAYVRMDSGVVERITRSALSEIKSLEDVFEHPNHHVRAAAFRALLDELGVKYGTAGYEGVNSEYVFAEGANQDEIKIRFSDHERQSRLHTPADYNFANSKFPVTDYLRVADDLAAAQVVGGELYQLTPERIDEAKARMERAERQGFKIMAFRGARARPSPDGVSDQQMIGGGWFTDAPQTANTYARPHVGAPAFAMEARLRLRNPMQIDAKGKHFDQIPVSLLKGIVPDHLLKGRRLVASDSIVLMAKHLGHDGVIFRNMKDDFNTNAITTKPATIYNVFDAKDIRSAFAAFDDAKSEEAGLLNQRGDPKGWGETSPPPDLPPIRLDLSAVREDYGEDAVRRLPRAIRERSGAGSSVTDMLETIRGVRKTLKRKPPKSLSAFIRSKGKQGTISSPGARGPNGIKGSAPELKAMGLENLINETSGMDIDYVREMAAEVGYLEDGATINDLLDALDRESRGDPVYRAEDMAQAEDIGNAEAWQSWLSEGGVDIFETNDKVLRKQVSDFVTQNGEGAMSPDDAVELLGFTSGEALLKALAEVGSRERYLNDLTRREMNREFGNMMEDGTLEMEARQMAEAELVSRHAEIELEALARAVGEVAAGRMAKQMAKDALALMTVKEIRANGRFLQAERREMRNALDATRKGDYAQAFIHKRRQLVNMHLYNEARKAADKLEKHRRDLQKYETSESRRKSIAPDYREKIDALLEAYELRVSKQGPKEQRNRLSAAQWVLEMTEQGRESEITPEAFLLAQAAEDKVWSTLTLEEAEYLVATVANMAHLGKLKERLLNEREKRAFSAVVDGLVERLVAAPTNKDREQNVSATVGERTATWLRKAHARLTRMEFQFARLDGGENGALFNALWRPMAEAADRETVMARDGAEKMNALYEAYGPRERGRLFSQRVDTPELQWPGKKSPTRMDVITVGLNWGNEGNRSALLEGYGWDGAAVETMLNRVLTDKDWDFIEGTWALIGEYRDPAFALEKKITGVAPKAVEGVTFTLASGREIKGQYYPLKYSTDAPTPKAVTQQRLEEKDMLADLGKTYSKPMTKTGHLKERVGSGGKRVKLSISVFHEHVQNVIHDINYRPAVIDAHKIIQNERFAQAYINAAGREQYDMLRPWIAAVATERAEEPGGFVTDIMQRARRNFSIVAMGYKIGTATQQLTGILAAPALIGTKYTTQGFLKAFGGNPASFWGSWQWVSEKSEFMKDRPQGFDRDVRMVTNRMQERTPLGKMQRNAFIFIGMMDTAVSTGAWIGAYDKAMDGNVKGIEAGNEEDAIVYADSVIRRTQVAGRMQDLPQIMRGTELEKLMTSVYSYFSGLYNLTAAQIQDVRGGQVHPAAFAANMSLLFVVIPMLAEVLAGRFPPPDDEDEPGEKAAKALVSNAVSTVPFLRDIVNAGMNPQFGYNMSPAGSIIDRGVQGVARAADGIESEYEARLALDSLGVLFGLPTGQLWITGEYAYGVATGEEDPSENPADALREAALKDTR